MSTEHKPTEPTFAFVVKPEANHEDVLALLDLYRNMITAWHEGQGFPLMEGGSDDWPLVHYYEGGCFTVQPPTPDPNDQLYIGWYVSGYSVGFSEGFYRLPDGRLASTENPEGYPNQTLHPANFKCRFCQEGITYSDAPAEPQSPVAGPGWADGNASLFCIDPETGTAIRRHEPASA
jgi:hypothetical protein